MKCLKRRRKSGVKNDGGPSPQGCTIESWITDSFAKDNSSMENIGKWAQNIIKL